MKTEAGGLFLCLLQFGPDLFCCCFSIVSSYKLSFQQVSLRINSLQWLLLSKYLFSDSSILFNRFFNIYLEDSVLELLPLSHEEDNEVEDARLSNSVMTMKCNELFLVLGVEYLCDDVMDIQFSTNGIYLIISISIN